MEQDRNPGQRQRARRCRCRSAAVSGVAILAAWSTLDRAAAQVRPEPGSAVLPGAAPERQTPVPAEGAPGPPGQNLLGTLGGLRTGLERFGISLGLIEASEVFGNATGGRARGAVYEGLTTASLDFDLEKTVGLSGGAARVSALQIHGRGLSTTYVYNLNTTSSIEGTHATRLFELWYDQVFLGGKVDLKLGQQSTDLEFATSSYAGLFLNASFGWPTLFAVDLPAGGPAYPLAALGARLRAKPAGPLTVMLGVFNGSPSKFGQGDPQGRRNPSGTNFGLSQGVFVIGEVQYAINGGQNATGLPGVYKLGAWYNSNAFTNQFLPAAAATPGAIPPRAARADWSVYGVADQLLWRQPGSEGAGIGVFARAAGAPNDRNQVSFFLDAGVTYKGVFGRGDDTIGLGLGWARISDTARSADAVLAALNGVGFIRSREVVLELTYQAPIAPWLQVQPDFQYVVNPGGGIANPDRPGKRIGNAAIFGVRTNISF